MARIKRGKTANKRRKNLLKHAKGFMWTRGTKYRQAKEALLGEIAAGPLDPEGFGIAGAYTAKLFAIEEAYSAGLSALELPARSAVDPAADAFYLEWEEIHRHRETVSMEDFAAKYGKLAEKAAAAGG